MDDKRYTVQPSGLAASTLERLIGAAPGIKTTTAASMALMRAWSAIYEDGLCVLEFSSSDPEDRRSYVADFRDPHTIEVWQGAGNSVTGFWLEPGDSGDAGVAMAVRPNFGRSDLAEQLPRIAAVWEGFVEAFSRFIGSVRNRVYIKGREFRISRDGGASVEAVERWTLERCSEEELEAVREAVRAALSRGWK